MSNITFTEKESHPASFKPRREALSMTVEELAQAAKVSAETLVKLEATAADSGQYDSQAAFSVEHALQTAERNKP